MRLFCHVSEYGPNVFQLLPPMLFFSAPLVLWAPSAAYMDEASKEAKEKGKWLLNSSETIDLIKRGDIRVIGRQKYLTDPASREKHPWGPYAAWTKGYDDVIAEIAHE